jgi:dTDP-4-amino-4,6-dideoxygalactose transaminase
MKVPFLDLHAHHQPIREQIDAAISKVIDSSAYAGGPFVATFEREFATYCDAQFSIGLGNGTDAIWLPLLALGVGHGDEVITSPSTFMATAEAISYCGARPVFVDIDESTYTLDPGQLEKAITPKTKAIIPVHLFGQMADMDPILEIARRHKIPVIEDACQAHGATYQGRKAGSVGIAAAFSFYPGKNLGALGEAGATTTNSSELADKIKVLRDHGQAKKYVHSMIGWNARMDGIQGAVLSVKLKQLDAANAKRQSHARLYNELLAGADEIITPSTAQNNQHVFHVYAVRVNDRDRVLQMMADKGISCAIHYPVPVHLQGAYSFLGYGKGSFPIAERCAEQFLSLPMYPELSVEQIHAVATALKECVASDAKPHSSFA